MKWGIVGLEDPMVHMFLKGFSESNPGELAGFTGVGQEKCQMIAQKYNVRHYADVAALVHEVDAVLVFTETADRAAAIKRVATFGKHVFCNPPFALTMEEARACAEFCTKQGVMLESVFPLRFAPSVLRVKAMLEEGQLGRVVAIRGTAIFDAALPAIDLMRWLADDEFRSVYAEIGSLFPDGDDCVLLTVDFVRGAIGSLGPSGAKSSFSDAEEDMDFEIIGTGGVVRLRIFGQELSVINNRDRRISSRFWGDHPALKAVEAYGARIQTGGWMRAAENAGMRAMAVSEAARRSAATGQPAAVDYR